MSIEARFSTRLGSFDLDVNFTAPGRGVTALFGHSGSGKTTLLRCIAGLQRAPGELRVNQEIWQSNGLFVPTHRRPLGYVFQEASLFPHLSVRKNLTYGQKRVASSQRRVLFDDAVQLVGIEHLLERNPAYLSGGERQRVAIARALLTSPLLLLMDEPLSALDERSKREILPYLERLHNELAIPVLYVSHSMSEVARLADHMVWLEAGRIKGEGPITEMLSRLDMGTMDDESGAVIDTVVACHHVEHHLTGLDSVAGRLWVKQLDTPKGHSVRVRLPAKDVSLALDPEKRSSILNVWQARVESIADTSPGQVTVRLLTEQGAVPILARITKRSCEELSLSPGTQVFARIKSVGLAL